MTDCGLDTVLALIGGKWKMLILYHVCHAPRRFGELRRLLSGISEKMLIQDLRQMQESGFFPFSCRQASMGVWRSWARVSSSEEKSKYCFRWSY